MTKRFKLCSLMCILFAVIQLTGCIEVTVQQPSTQQESVSSDQTPPIKPAPSIEGDKVPESTESWVRYVADQGGLSFNYPKGWNVEVDESAISIDSAETDEQLVMSMIPFDEGKDPTALATYFITLLQTNNPNMQASNWRTDPQTAGSQVVFDLSDEIGNKEYSGSGIVIRDSQQAIWFSYFTPSSTYSNDRGNELLQGFIESLASESESEDPNNNNSDLGSTNLSAKIDSNAKGFIFVLEFALGAPFTANQEQIILDELKTGWYTLSEDELSNYDQYPIIAKQLLTMGQEDLNVLREELEKTTMEWIDESPDSDKVVNIIRDHLNNKGKVVIDGDPPLTEMSLTAYSEVIAYSRLLRKNPEATPEQISSDYVNDIKNQVQDSWTTYTNEEQQQIATSPGIWFCLRTLVNNGSESEQDDVRSNLVKLTPETQTTNDSNNSNKPMSMAAHNAMMNIQQMTFNTYMWSRGFNYSPAYGKMW